MQMTDNLNSSLGCSLYYAARTIGTLIGSILMVKISSRKYPLQY